MSYSSVTSWDAHGLWLDSTAKMDAVSYSSFQAKSASFAVPSGLLVYPQYAHLEHVEPRHTRQLRTGTDGYFGKVGRWLREGF